MTNYVVTSFPDDEPGSTPIDVLPGGMHGPLRWLRGSAPVQLDVAGDAWSLTENTETATLRDPEVEPTGSATSYGREILRAQAARAGEISVQQPRRSRLGLDLTKFTAWVVSQPARRPRGRGTRSLGPMPVDAQLMAALEGFCGRHEVSKRQVVECLLTELLAGEVPMNPVSGERA